MLADCIVAHGYEIHYGAVARDGAEPLFADDGCRAGPVVGTVWHGLFENDAFRHGYLTQVSRITGRTFVVAPDTFFSRSEKPDWTVSPTS